MPRSVSQWKEFFDNVPEGFPAFLERWLFWGSLEHILDLGPLEPRDHVLTKNNTQVIRIANTVQRAENRMKGHPIGRDVNVNFIKGTPQTEPAGSDQEHDTPSHNMFTSKAADGHAVTSSDAEISMYKYCSRNGVDAKDCRDGLLVVATCLIHDLGHNPLKDEEDDPEDLSPLIPDIVAESHRFYSATIHYGPHTLASRKLSARRLLDVGWCPWDTHMLSQSSPVSFCFYLSQMSVPQSSQGHEHLHKPGSQSSELASPIRARVFCNEGRCLHRQIEQTTYRTAHAGCEEDKTCADVVVDTGALSDILRAGNIPLLSVEKEPNWKSKPLQPVPFDSTNNNPPYVAFSHV